MADAQGGAGSSGLERRRGGATPPRSSGVGCRRTESTTELRELLRRDQAPDSAADLETHTRLVYYIG